LVRLARPDKVNGSLQQAGTWARVDGIRRDKKPKPSTPTGRSSVQDVNSVAPAAPGAAEEGFWPKGWWSLVDFKIGIVPLPVFVVLLALIAAFTLTGSVPSDILMAIVLLSMGGFTCAELGKRIPIIRNIGAAAIFATFIPSALVFYHLLPVPIIDSVKAFTKDSNFLYLFISCIIVGSILGMDRGVLVQGFLKIFVPLLFAIGVSLTPWDKLMAAFTLPYLITIVSTVVAMITAGFCVGRLLGMYPIDTAIVTACHSGQGGTGDVAILTAANRMQLRPFAQIATRIGGAFTVTVLIVLARIG